MVSPVLSPLPGEPEIPTGNFFLSKLDEQDGRLFRSPVRATLPPLTGGGEGDTSKAQQPAGLAMLLTEPPFKPPGTPPMATRPLPHISTPPIPRKGQTGHTVAMGHRQSSKSIPPKAKKEVEEGQSLLERERAAAQHTAQQLVLTRANKQEADAVLLECWLNDVLMARPGHNGDVDLGQLGAGTLSGLAQFGLTRTQLMDTGLSAAVVERLYRSLYVYSIGFHDTLQDLISQGCATKQRAGVVTNLWKSFLTISEKSLKVKFQSEMFEVLQSSEDRAAEMDQMRQWVQFLGTANRQLEVQLAASGERAGAEAERAELAESEVAELREALAEERSAASAAAAHAAEEADRCVDAQEQLIEVRQERNVHARESEETRSKLVALEAAHAVLQREHAQLQANYGGVKKSLLEDREKLRAATNSQNLALQAKDEAVANAQKAVCQLSDELRTNTILHAEAEKHKLHAEELKAHLADRDQQMLHQGQRLTTLIAQHGALKADFAEANRQLSAANAELREKRPALENATNQLRELRAELQSTKEAKNSLHVAYKLLQTTHIAMRLEKKRVGMLLDQLGPGGVNEVMTRISNLTVALVLATKAQWASQEREAVLRQEKAVHVQRIKTAEEDQAKMSQQMTELLQALEAQLAKLRTDHSKEKEELLDAAAQASRREAEENAKLQGDLEEKQHLMAKVERDRMQLASKMEQAMRSLDELDTTVRETTSKLEQETGLRISLTGQVEQLSEEGAAVKQVLATTTLKYQQASATAMTTQQQLDAERARAWALDEELSTARTALERKRGKKKGWKGRAEQAEPALTLAQQHLSDRTTELKEASVTLAAMERDARIRDGEIEHLTDQVVTLTMDQTLLQTELDALDEAHTSLRQAHEQLEAEAAEQSRRIRLLEEEKESDKERIALLNVECETLQGEMERLQIELDALGDSSRSALAQKCEEMEQMRQALQATVDERAATVAQMTEQMAARDVEIGELTALRDQLTLRMKELEESNAALQEKVETIPELKERIVEVEKEKAEEIVELREKLETKIEKKDNQLRKLIAAEEDMKTRTKDAEDRLAETKAKSRVKADLDEQNIKRLTDDLHTSRYEHDKTSAELEACKAEVLSLHVAQNDLREAKAESEESLHAKIAEWTAKYQDREATVVQERSELATEKAALADRIRVFKEESESAKLAVEDLQARLTKTEGKLAAAIVDKQQAIEDLTLRRVEQVEKLQAEFELQKGELNRQIAEHLASIAHLQQCKADLEAHVERAEADLAQKRENIASLEDKIRQLEHQLTELQGDYEADIDIHMKIIEASRSSNAWLQHAPPPKQTKHVVFDQNAQLFKPAANESIMCIEQEFDTVKLRRIIMQIYCTKINADIQADERDNERTSLVEFTYDHFLRRFIIRMFTEVQLRAMVETLIFNKHIVRFQMFAKLLGLGKPGAAASKELQQERSDFFLTVLAGLLQLNGGLHESEFESGTSRVSLRSVQATLTKVFADVSAEALAEPEETATREADAHGELDLDRALSIAMEFWEMQTELLEGRVQLVIEREGGDVQQGIDHVGCSSVVSKVAPQAAGDKRLMRVIFREAMQLDPDTSTVFVENIVRVMRGHGLISVCKTRMPHPPPATHPSFDDFVLLGESWRLMKDKILSMSDDEYGVTPRGRASSNELLQLVESFEDLIKHRQAEAAWAMYRRIIVCFIGMVSREQLKIKETRNARPSRASIGSRFKLAAKTVMKASAQSKLLAADLARQTVERSMQQTAAMLASATPDVLSPIHSEQVSRSVSMHHGEDEADFAFDMHTIVNALDRTGRARRSQHSTHSSTGHPDKVLEEGAGSNPASPGKLSRMSSLKLSLPGGFEPAQDVAVPLSAA